ncbi:hypothetical protein [Acidaminobacter sp.]|uniref:hypothetical protein n=1 Tax=Acidaminobacter sp. TaxID=1872102 RepID=UPI0025681537|nr:hypothetical protein [Acidaminobacter sp.]MDK9712142.1 hypothetical protein [Acidaminobacter sp.]
MKTRRLSLALILAMLLGLMVLGTTTFAVANDIAVLTTSTAVNGDAETLVIPNPGAAAGRLLIAQITYEKGQDALPIVAPTGWKEIITTNAYVDGGYKDIGQALYYKVAGANEPSGYIWTFSQMVKALGGIAQYEGVDGDAPIFASGGQGGYGDSTGKNQLLAPTVSGVEGGKLIAFFGFKEMAFLESPDYMHQVYQAWDPDNDYAILASEQQLSMDALTGDRIARSWENDRLSESVESQWVAQQIVLKPAGASGGTTPGTIGTPNLNAGEQLKLWKLIEGDPYGNLNEGTFLKRSEMMVIFARMMGRFDEAYAYKFPSTFSDGVGHWAASYVAYAQNQGWTSGMGNNQFGFEVPHRAREAAVFMLKALGYKADVDFTWNDAFDKAKALGLFDDVSTPSGENILRGDLFKVMVHTLMTNSKGESKPLGEKLNIF